MTTPPTKDLRQFIRIPFSADVRLQVPEHTFTVQLVDIALKGALVQCKTDHAFTLQGKCRLLLPMAENGDGIVMVGHIAHLQNDLVGIECSDIDVTSLTRLRRLIELNCGDANLMHRDIRHLFGQK
jgi:hypothetical protein